MKTLLLDTLAWDVVLDAHGDWALADEPYALAQDAASACRTVQGEVYYDTTLGVPYFTQILGKMPSAQLIKSAFIREALRVPGVASATCFLQAIEGRQLAAQVQVKGVSGGAVAATGPFVPPGLIPPQWVGQFDFSDPRQSQLIGV